MDFNRYDWFNNSDVERVFIQDRSQCSGDVLYHPYYKDEFAPDYDVAIVFLPEPVTDVQPVQLNEDKNVPNEDEELDVAGWGVYNWWDEISEDGPRSVTLNYIGANEMCSLPPYMWAEWLITDSTMCVIGDEGKSAYLGDSGECFHKLLVPLMKAANVFLAMNMKTGGPLNLVKTEQEGGGPSNLQVGIVSFGHDDGYHANYPNVFTRVSEVVDWVKETVCERKGELCKPQPKSGKVSKSTKKNLGRGGAKYPDTCVPVSTFAPTFMPSTEKPTITAQPTRSPTPKSWAAVNIWQDNDIAGVIDHQSNVLLQCKTRSYDLGLYAIPGPHFFIGATAIAADKNAGSECPPSIVFVSIEGAKKIFEVKESMDESSKHPLGEFELGDILEAEKKAVAIKDSEYDISSNNCAHYARDIWRSLGIMETSSLADFLVLNLINSDEVIDTATEMAGGHRVLAALAAGGHGALEHYIKHVVTSQLDIE